MIAIDPNNAEWYTPPAILERVYAVLGNVNLDPCCNKIGSPVVKADRYFRLPVDGLKEKWGGEKPQTIFMNPPYGREIKQWALKLSAEYSSGNIKAAIALLPVKTDTRWWAELSHTLTCWCAIHGRVKFDSPNGRSTSTGTFASALVLLTHDDDVTSSFIREFEEIGVIWKR